MQEPNSNTELDKALAYLIASTKRGRRSTDLVQAANAVKTARRILGSLRAVSDRIGISEEMLREFSSVEKLAPAVRKMVAERALTSVDVVYRLSMLPKEDQTALADHFASGRITSKELREVVALSRRGVLSIPDALARVLKGRTEKRYQIRFSLPADFVGDLFLTRLGKLIGSQQVISFERLGAVAIVTITESGEQALRLKARQRSTTKACLVQDLLKAE